MKARLLLPFFAGLLFAGGLALSGMTDPAKVIGFLDVTGAWDPSLALTMLAAIAVHLPMVRLAQRRSAASQAGRLELPVDERIDGRLLLGAAVFGLGWGLAGYCPGPLLVSVASGALPASVACLGMLGGIGLHELVFVSREARLSAPSSCGADLV